ncbi:MAG: nitronate monooxygenase [Planctomycetes bacterium]|nr:nitronate monooxygenase [Planctomycetota bacterium]
MSLELNKLWQRGRDFLGVKYPIMCGAMTWISEANLVSTVCNAGGFGVLAGGNMPQDLFAQAIEETQSKTKGPFGVNLIAIAPNYQSHLEVSIAKKVPFVIFAGSFPKREELKKVKAVGTKVICFASTESIAKRMIKYETDALILEGSEAGGHIGPVSLTVLLQEVLFKFSDRLPIFVAGGIATGKMMTYLLLMGAVGIQMGTRFVMSREAQTHPAFKDAFKRAKARDAESTPQFHSSLPVVSVRALRNQGTKTFGKLQLNLIKKLQEQKIHQREAQYEVEKYWIGALRRAVQDGDIAQGSLMAGQSVGLVSDVKSVKEIIDDMVVEAMEELKKLSSGNL